MKILLTGATGMLGSAISSSFGAKGWECEPLAHTAVDLSRFDNVKAIVADCDIFIHAAANTNVEECEINPIASYRDNTLLTEILATAAQQCGIRMVYISSTGVYGVHKDTPYHEYDDVHPTTHHHKAKWLGEKTVLRDCRSLVIRTGWLFGGEPGNKKNFVARRVEEALQCNTEMFSNQDQRGCPTFVGDVAERLFYMLQYEFSGLFNCVNSGSASRYEYVESIVKTFGLNTPISPVSCQMFSRKAQVSNNEMAINLKQNLLGMPPMRDWNEALSEYMIEHILPVYGD